MTTLPTLHLNGTGREALQRDYQAAYKALVAFRDAFAAIEFNARDYYPQGNQTYSQARLERDLEIERIGQLMMYLEMHLAHLYA